VEAYRQLELQTDRQFATLTDPAGPYRMRVVSTSVASPYSDADELIESVLGARTLEVTTSRADRPHPLLGGEAGSAYWSMSSATWPAVPCRDVPDKVVHRPEAVGGPGRGGAGRLAAKVNWAGGRG
jgi:hypothetical protein